MTINFEGYEIEIKAKKENGRYNKKDTGRMINLFSIFAAEAAKSYNSRCRTALAEEAQEFANITYNLLLEAGHYNR